jgi:hypothetical protein
MNIIEFLKIFFEGRGKNKKPYYEKKESRVTVVITLPNV